MVAQAAADPVKNATSVARSATLPGAALRAAVTTMAAADKDAEVTAATTPRLGAAPATHVADTGTCRETALRARSVTTVCISL